MKRSLEKSLISMSVAEREEAIGKLINITREIEKYSHSFFWQGHGKTSWSTYITVQLGTDVIEFDSDYHESYRHCYYNKTLTFNGKKTTCLLLKNIIAKLRELNAPPVEDDVSIL